MHSTLEISQIRPRTKNINTPGLLIFLASESFLFGSLFFTYFYLKINTPVWPPAGGATGHRISHHQYSGYAVQQYRRMESLNIRPQRPCVRSGGGFCWRRPSWEAASWGSPAGEWAHQSFSAQSSAYGAIYYTMTGFHALHVLGGILVLLALYTRIKRGRYSMGSAIEVGSLYWHYVDFIWILVFTILFLIR